MGGLPAAGKAVLGIVRALSGQARLVVLDEPTASLPEPDALHLFEILRRLRANGTGIIYVTHRLNELFGLADRITVLRDGRHVRTAPAAQMTPQGLVQDMLGRAVDMLHAPHAVSGRAKPVLQVAGLRIQGIGPLDFEVAAGEIVGLVGLRGAGQEMIGRAVFGALRPHAGEIRLDGTALPPDDAIPDRIARGIALLAGDRGRESALPGMSVQENLLPNPGIVRQAPWRMASPAAERRRTAATLRQLDVRPADPAALIEWLSGGNQQKVFVGRWLESQARLFVMEEPTAGVDIGAKFAIHALLRGVADKGAAILVVSSDFEEVATLCDRALVIGRGVITSELQGPALTTDSVLARASLGTGQAGAIRRRRRSDEQEFGTVRDVVNPEGSAGRRAGRRLSDVAAVYGLAVVFVLVMVLFGALRPHTFFSSININTVLVGQSVTALLALGEMVPLATKQFDLSVGFHLGMAQILIIGLQVNSGLPWPVAALIVLAIAVLVGLLNSLLITRFGIDSFIATMGVGTLLYGVSNWYSGGQQIVAPEPVRQLHQHDRDRLEDPAAGGLCRHRRGAAVGGDRAAAGRAQPVRDRRQPARGRTDRHPHRALHHRRLRRLRRAQRAGRHHAGQHPGDRHALAPGRNTCCPPSPRPCWARPRSIPAGSTWWARCSRC